LHEEPVARGRARKTGVLKDLAIAERLAEGFRYVRHERRVLVLLAIVASVSLVGFPYLTIMPMTAHRYAAPMERFITATDHGRPAKSM